MADSESVESSSLPNSPCMATERKEIISKPSLQVKVAVIGSGAFGTALATVSARAGNNVFLYARKESVVLAINETRHNPNYLTEFELEPNITAVHSIAHALEGACLVILCLPCQCLPDWIRENAHLIDPTSLLVNTAKGLYLRDECLLSEAIEKALGRVQPFCVLSGPSFAKEIMLGFPTAVVVASKVT